MPDFYTRMHAASVIETLGCRTCILLGLLLQAGFTLVAVKLLIIGVLIFFASPTATHALARAAMVRGLQPLLGRQRRTRHRNTDHQCAAGADGGDRLGRSARSRNLFAVIILRGAYSFLMATVLVALDAVDVAMTEASVGAGISTVLLLGALYLCKCEEAQPVHKPWLPLAHVGCGGRRAGLRHARLPEFSDPQAPIHPHVVPRYLNELKQEVDVPNVVTAVLASYRGYDTLGRDDGGVHRRRRRRRAAAPPAQATATKGAHEA